jgi:hypothetical protein
LIAPNLKVKVGAATAGAINASAIPASNSLEKRFIRLLLAFDTDFLLDSRRARF